MRSRVLNFCSISPGVLLGLILCAMYCGFLRWRQIVLVKVDQRFVEFPRDRFLLAVLWPIIGADVKSLFFLISFLYLLCEVECGAASASPPNIVFILIDDLRYDTFGYMGHPFIETPHIDALA